MKKLAVTLESLDIRLESLDEKIETSIESLDKKIESLNTKIETSIASLDKKIDEKFDQLFDFLSENIMMRPEVEKVIEENNQKMVSQSQTTLVHYAKQYKNTDEEVLALQYRVSLIEKHVGL